MQKRSPTTFFDMLDGTESLSDHRQRCRKLLAMLCDARQYNGLCKLRGEPMVRTGVAGDEIFYRFWNVLTFDIAAGLDFEGDVS